MRDIETSDQPVDPANFSVLADDLQADSSWTQSLLQRSSVRTGQTSVTTKVASLSDIGCDKMPLVPTVVHDSSSRGFFSGAAVACSFVVFTVLLVVPSKSF